MNTDKSYLAERLAERRRRVRAGIAGVGVLMGLGTALLLSYPTPGDALALHAPTTTAAQSPQLDGSVTTALR